MVKKRRKAKKTGLLVGEGPTDKAFLEYLKSLYIVRDCGISLKIQAANGGSPACIVEYALKQSKNKAYDKVAVLMDTDKPWGEKLERKAKANKIGLIGSTPCIEGLILAMLDKPVPYESHTCKLECNKLFTRKLIDKESYQQHLTKEYIEDIRFSVPALEQILSYYFFN